MTRAAVAVPSPNADFWPAKSLSSWVTAPEKTFEAWLAEQRILGGGQFRESSQETYTAIFCLWLKALSATSRTLLEACTADASAFFAERSLEPVSRRRYLQLLDRVYQHLKMIGWEGQNPMSAELRKERELEVAPPMGLPEAEKDALIEYLTRQSGWKASRDRALATLLLGAGLRSNEAANLLIDDLYRHPQWQIRVVPSGVHREHQTIVLPEGPWRGWLDAWLQEKVGLSIPGGIVCPATLKGTPYSTSGMFRRIETWCSAAGITAPQRGANLLRNTFAKQALTCGLYSLEQVQKFLGHEDTRATLRHLE